MIFVTVRKVINILKRGRPQEIRNLLVKYEKYLSPAALVSGFIVDSLTLTRVDLWFDNLILLSYLTIIAVSILLINASNAGRLQGAIIQRGVIWLPLAMQFAFGGLFSGFVVLYSRSASILASWPFLLTLVTLLVGNEFFKERYPRLFFQLSIFFIAIFSYLIFAVPVILDAMGPFVFLISGGLSLLIMALIIRGISAVAPWSIQQNKRKILTIILIIYAAFNLLYFTNIIPPIPLALKEMVIAHSVEHTGPNAVRVMYEPPPWYKFYRDFDNTYHRLGNEPVYVYSSIFAPTNLRTAIVHEWAYFDESHHEWTVTDRIQYSIFGGRNEGYRGFSIKTNISPGKWRVSVKTKNGQLLGRTEIEVAQSPYPPILKIESK